MRQRIAYLLTLTSALLPSSALANLKVVATTADLAALAQAVGGELVDVTALSSPSQDPHYVDARPNLMLPMRSADLLIVNGLELEVGWLPPLQTNARNPKIQLGGAGYLDASATVERLQVLTVRLDRALGDIHPGGNPHYTFDPRSARKVVAAVGDRLAHLDRDNAATYLKRAGELDQQLASFAAQQTARFAALAKEKRRVVVYHQSLVYLFDWLGIEQVSAIEPRPGIPPDPGHIKDVLLTMRSNKVRVIVQEEFYQRGPSETLSKLTQGELVVLPGGARFTTGQSYLQHLQEIVDGLYAALSR